MKPPDRVNVVTTATPGYHEVRAYNGSVVFTGNAVQCDSWIAENGYVWDATENRRRYRDEKYRGRLLDETSYRRGKTMQENIIKIYQVPGEGWYIKGEGANHEANLRGPYKRKPTRDQITRWQYWFFLGRKTTVVVED